MRMAMRLRLVSDWPAKFKVAAIAIERTIWFAAD
jgi:hypothetical protein